MRVSLTAVFMSELSGVQSLKALASTLNSDALVGGKIHIIPDVGFYRYGVNIIWREKDPVQK